MVETHKKVDIARKQLETAIKLFFLGEDYFSVITLAGAVDSIYGSILVLLDKEPSLHSWARTEKTLYRALSAKI